MTEALYKLQINCLFNELESQAQAEQKETDASAQEIGADIMADLEKIEACVANIAACKQSLKHLSYDSQNAES